MPLGTPGTADIGELVAQGNTAIVMNVPSPCTTSTSRWLRIIDPIESVVWTVIEGPAYSGTFTAAATLCLPSGAGDFSVEVMDDRTDAPLGHLDLMHDGAVHVNDAPVGSFSHGAISFIATIGETTVAYRIVSGGRTVATTQSHRGLSTFGFSGLRFQFPAPHSGTAYLDAVQIGRED